MRDRILRIVSLMMTLTILAVTVTACGNDDNSNAGVGHSFKYTLVGNPDTLDPQLAVNASAKMVLANLFEGLFTIDDSGSVVPALVSEYSVSEDGLCYRMTLREDSYWYDAMHEDTTFSKEEKVAVNAMDFVCAFQRLFDPMYHSPYAEQFLCLENAQEILDGKQDPTLIGVTANTLQELEIHLAYPNADFLQLLTLPAALPCNEEYFESTKGRYGLDESSIIGNGPFAMQRWLYDPYGKYNVIQLCRNPLAHEVSKISPVDLNFYIEKADSDAENLFAQGSTDCLVTTDSLSASADGVTVSGAYSLTLGLAASSNSPYSNPNIMQALTKSIDRTQFVSGQGDVKPAYAVLPPAVMLLNKSVRELIAETAYLSYDVDAAESALQAGMDDLDIMELPEGKILVPTGLMDYEILLNILEQWHTALGVHMSLEEVSGSTYQSRIASGNFDIALLAVTGENHEAQSLFEAFLSNPAISCGNEATVRSLLADAAKAADMTARVALYRKAEAEILASDCFVPLFYKQRYLLCREGVSEIVFNPFSGALRFRDAKCKE